MEELRTTEVLDREILEDARKKAFKILKNADDSLGTQDRDWEKKIQDSLGSIRNSYAERTKREGDEVLARLPLDKRRFRTENSESSLVRAMDTFLGSLSREKLLYVLERELYERFKAWADGEKGTPEISGASVSFSGVSLSETRTLLKKVIGRLAEKPGNFVPGKVKVEDWELKEDTSGGEISRKNEAAAHEFPSIVISTQDMKLIASVEDAAKNLLKEKRAELATALLGEGVLND